MSAIDSIRHARIGLLQGIPIYLCLEASPWLDSETDDDELSSYARKHSVCVGGGSGEHAAIVVPDVSAVVLAFLRHHQNAAQVDWPRFHYCDRETPETWAAELSFTPNEGEPHFSSYLTLQLGEFFYFMLPELYDAKVIPAELDEVRHGLEAGYSTDISLPWVSYGGNGTNYFHVAKADEYST